MRSTFSSLLLAVALVGAGIELAAASATLAVRPRFPSDNVWNVAIDTLAVDANSSAYVATIGATKPAHADFGTVFAGVPNGIPYVVVTGAQPRVAVSFDYADESDPGPYPIPSDAPIEGGPQSTGDRHVLVVDRDAGKLYELFAAYPNPDGSWHAGSGAVFDLDSNALRPATWTSADAAGLPILPGLVRYEEVAAGAIDHALRFTAPQTRNTYVWPARHEASKLTTTSYPPMGQRFRLKASFDISPFGPNVQIILRALKKYGMFLADSGSSWYLSGSPDPRWDDNELHQLSQLHGSDFEAVDESSLMIDPNSGQTRATGPAVPPPPSPAPGSPSPPATKHVIEFYWPDADHYFLSGDDEEVAALDAGRLPRWVRTGESFDAFAAGDLSDPKRAPVCRFYGRPEAGINSHFYSASPAECALVIDRFSAAWIYESSDVFGVVLPNVFDGSCPKDMLPVYRVYNQRSDVNHRYTTSRTIRAQMIARGWTAEGYGQEGVAMCVPAQ